jgi:TPR repeat protein
VTLDSNNNNYRQNFIFAITFFILIFSICPGAFGVLPPEVYKRAIDSSDIKAIAVVEKVEIIYESNMSTFKKVFFKLEKSLTRGFFHKKVPKKFSGSCYSVDHKWQNPGTGGTIHYYPWKGAKVLVTVSSDGGGITSYTTLTPAFEEELNKNDLKNIAFGMGHASIKRSAMSPERKEEIRIEAMVSSAYTYMRRKNYQKAFQDFKTAARLGHTRSQNKLGELYLNGIGVEQDVQKAIELFKETAEQNSFWGIYNLGVIYASGKGVKQSYKDAHALFLKSANLGYRKAQFNLGVMYYNGMGIDKNEATAFKWFKKAADKDVLEAMYVVGKAHESGEGLPRDIYKAKSYYKKAAFLGYQDAKIKCKELGIDEREGIIPTIEEILASMKENLAAMDKQMFFDSLYSNNIQNLKDILDKGNVDVNSQNDTGQTALHIAMDEQVIQLLISKGADVNARDDQGMTPIFTKEVELTKILVNAGADISLKSNGGNTALMWYAYSGYLDGIKYLVSQGADIKIKNRDNQTALDIAETFGHLKVVEYLESLKR